jgi:hypothetical protein
MRALALTSLLLLGACVVHDPAPRPPSPAPPPPRSGPPPPSPAPVISRDEAIEAAFRHVRQRGLAVDRVERAHLDGAGRWHVDVRGRADRARVLLDGRDGRLLRGRFRTNAPEGGDEDLPD